MPVLVRQAPGEGAPDHWRQILADTALACGLEPGEIRDTLNSAMGADR